MLCQVCCEEVEADHDLLGLEFPPLEVLRALHDGRVAVVVRVGLVVGRGVSGVGGAAEVLAAALAVVRVAAFIVAPLSQFSLLCSELSSSALASVAEPWDTMRSL